MTRLQETHVAAPFVLLMLSQPVVGQNSLDLQEADARDSAYKIMSATEDRFDCRFEEYAMQEVGNESDIRYIFHVTAEGNECREALVFATSMAARDDKLMFRQVGAKSQHLDDLLILNDQVLIHEVNPEIDDEKPPEQ